MSNLVLTIQEGQIKVNNEHHLKNYIKYLFSNSGSHQFNELTPNNSYIVDFDSFEINYVDNSIGSQRKFNSSNKELSFDYEKLNMDISYIFYAFKKDNLIISNILASDGENIGLCIGDDIISHIVHKYCNGDMSVLHNSLEDLVGNNDFERIVTIEELENNKLKETYNRYIHKKLNSELPKNNVISISHLDQESPYHIHRLFYK